MKKAYFLLLLVFLVLPESTDAQNLPVGSVLDEVYRNYQLMGKADSNLSFSIRPFSAQALKRTALFYPDSLTTRSSDSVKHSFQFSMLPLNIQQQFNSHHPYGWNDGNLIPARGYQQLISAGFYARFKFLSIQLNPEFIFAENKKFNGFAQANQNDFAWQAYYNGYNRIDQPERFGNGPYVKLLPGQSNISLTFDPVAISFSTENLWWGPGIRSSLTMSNTATGFKHLSLKTGRPIGTPIGLFEAQVIGGRLEGSGYAPLMLDQSDPHASLYAPKRDDWRYFSGLNIVYQPKWIQGLSLGFIRTFQLYNDDIIQFSEYLPVLSSSGPKSTQTAQDDDITRDQLASLFARWYSKEFHTEIYLEYGRNDNPGTFRDLLLQPQHTRGYVFGLRRLFPSFRGHADEFFQVGFEMTELALTRTTLIRESPPWYRHGVVRHGYTNNGELLGAGIGPGSNLQSLSVAWLKGIKKLGLQFERYEHNADFFYDAFTGPYTNLRRNWVDLSIVASGSWDFNRLIVNAKLGLIQSLNYNWEFRPDPDPSKYWTPGNDVTNFHAQVGLGYRF